MINTGSRLRTPWRVEDGNFYHLYPRIVDADGGPICSFGNQGRHRGIAWAIIVSRKIVKAVNARYPCNRENNQEPSTRE